MSRADTYKTHSCPPGKHKLTKKVTVKGQAMLKCDNKKYPKCPSMIPDPNPPATK